MKGSRPLTTEEIDTIVSFLSKTSHRNALLFTLGHRSGFRISELLSIKVKNVSQYGQILDYVTVERQNTKGKIESRSVVLHPSCKEMLRAYVATMPLSARLFPIERIQAWKILTKAFTTLRIPGKLGTHCMRKTFANRVYNKLGKDIVQTQKALGHKNLNNTIAYLSFAQENIDQAILSD